MSIMADQQFTFLVNGRPRPKQSARFVKGRVRSVVKTNPKLAHWDAAIKEAALSAMAEAKSSDRWQPHTREPLFLIMDFRLPIKDPSRQGYPHTNKPDADNLAKQVMDALENIGWRAYAINSFFAGDGAVAGIVPEDNLDGVATGSAEGFVFVSGEDDDCEICVRDVASEYGLAGSGDGFNVEAHVVHLGGEVFVSNVCECLGHWVVLRLLVCVAPFYHISVPDVK